MPRVLHPTKNGRGPFPIEFIRSPDYKWNTETESLQTVSKSKLNLYRLNLYSKSNRVNYSIQVQYAEKVNKIAYLQSWRQRKEDTVQI